ncbi:MAG: 16S rRNA processing protein RimM [Firmicutes bacterium]|nr:16S rRNA processing protein RimM [Bacillota bacterium]
MEPMATIGKVISTHGIKGALKVQPYSDFPERVKKLERVFLEIDGEIKPYPVLDAFVNGRYWVISLAGIEGMEAAEQLRGTSILIPLSERVELPQDTYYLDQIIGLNVYTVDGQLLGKVQDILQTGSNDVYVVHSPQGAEILIPALKDVVKKVDLKRARLEVEVPAGLI